MFLLTQGDRRYHFAVLRSLDDSLLAFDGRPFPCLLFDAGGDWPPDARAHLARTLIALGCRYAVCAGRTCSRWEAEFDGAFIDLELTDSEREERFVMTTSHADEPLDDVAFFFVSSTGFRQHAFDDFLVLQRGPESPEADSLRELVTSHAAAHHASEKQFARSLPDDKTG